MRFHRKLLAKITIKHKLIWVGMKRQIFVNGTRSAVVRCCDQLPERPLKCTVVPLTRKSNENNGQAIIRTYSMKPTILVTGSGGFVGFATVKALLALGHTVKAFELTGSPYLSGLYDLAAKHPDISVLEGDIIQMDDVRSAMQGVTHVVHSAALLNSIARTDAFHAVNVQGTQNAMDAASEAGVKRFLLVSTSDVFGIPDPGEIIRETTPYRPWHEPYADTKIAACRALKAHHKRHGLNYTIIYPGWVYGPGDRQFFPAITDMLREKYVFLWHRNQPYAVDFIYIDDLVTAITNALFNPAAENEDFLILNEQAHHTPEMIFRWMAEYLGINIVLYKLPYWLMMQIARTSQWLTQKGFTRKHLLSTTDVKAFGNDFRFSTAKARNTLKWRPQMAEPEGFLQYFRWAGISPAAAHQAAEHSAHNESH